MKIKPILFLLLMLFLLWNSLWPQDNIKGLEKELKGILTRVSPSLVKVISENHKKYIATGIAIEGDLVLTSTLITDHPYKHIYVKSTDNKKYSAAIVGKDGRSSLILLKLESKAMTPIKEATGLDVGDWIGLVGVFYNTFPSIFQGIVSSISDDELILNAPVVPGSPGGAVVDKNGRLVGVIRGSFGFSRNPDLLFKNEGSEILLRGIKTKHRNLCYATPVRRVLEISEQLKKFGQVKRGWLGVHLVSGDEKNGPVVITGVLKNSPAQKAGIKKGDIVVSIDKQRIKNAADVTRIVRSLPPGKVIKVEVQRNKKLERLLVTLGRLKEEDRALKFQFFDDFRYSSPEYFRLPELRGSLPEPFQYVFQFGNSRTLGAEVTKIGPETAKKYGATRGYGLAVSRVQRGSAAEKAGLKRGDIITGANGKKVKSMAEIAVVLQSLEDDEAVLLEIEREGKIKKIRAVPHKRHYPFVDWNRFKDRIKQYSVEIYDRTRDRLAGKMQEIKHKLDGLKMGSSHISEEKLKAIREEIEIAKAESLRQYKKAYEKLAKQRKLEEEKINRFIKETLNLKKELEKKSKQDNPHTQKI